MPNLDHNVDDLDNVDNVDDDVDNLHNKEDNADNVDDNTTKPSHSLIRRLGLGFCNGGQTHA